MSIIRRTVENDVDVEVVVESDGTEIMETDEEDGRGEDADVVLPSPARPQRLGELTSLRRLSSASHNSYARSELLDDPTYLASQVEGFSDDDDDYGGWM